ncbi:MAG: ammonium transporter [Verrucomicrobiota bacterium]|nr:ammonium transporter [Verrucomicrobiota bacterium]
MKISQNLSTLAVATVLAWGGALNAQDVAPPPDPVAVSEPAPAAPETPAAEPAQPPTLEEVGQRLTDLEAYFGNVAPSATDKGGKVAVSGPGHNAFLLICAALVLFMTLPGLALFYGGLVRSKNVLSVLGQCLGIAGLVAILWYVCGYSLIFGEESGPYIGSFKYLFLNGVGAAPNTNYTAWPSHSSFSMYQLMFAIITPALIVGAIAERMKFSAVLTFVGLWMFLVYFPLAHMVWGFDGLMNGVWNGSAKIPAIDFAGGTVVHMSSGWSALVLCLILGRRMGYGKEKMAPHSMVLCVIGTGMLWVGWYGFNAGSALAADGIASNAFMTTTLAAATAGFVWGMTEGIHKGRPSILGFCSGIVAGLVVITPAAGFVDASGAMIIGVLAALIPYFAVVALKPMLGFDDALDTFGIHGIGGTLGAILTGVLATEKVNANLIGPYATTNGLARLVTEGGLVGAQLQAVGITIVLSVVSTAVIAFLVKAVIGLRPTPEVETSGLDVNEHGEEGYSL